MKRIFINFVVFLSIIIMVGCMASPLPYFFVHISDTQLGMMEKDEGFSNESSRFAQTVLAINRLNPAFVVITGDLVNREGDEAQIAELKRLLAEVKTTIPVYYVPGNHDVGQTVSDEMLALYRTHFGNDRFSVLYENTRLIGINSQLILSKRDTLEMEQYQWLEDELKKSKENRYRFVFAHHPLFFQTVNEEISSQNLPVELRKYIDLFDKYDVSYMFVGHLHRNHTVQAGNLTIVVTNSISASRSDEPLGIRIVKVFPDKIVHDYYSLETLPEKIFDF